MKIPVLSTLVATMLFAAPSFSRAAVLFEVSNVTWQGGTAGPAITLTNPATNTPAAMNKTDTYYIQFTVELTSSVPGYVQGAPGAAGDFNRSNTSYPFVSTTNKETGGGAFLFYAGGNYNDSNLFASGFSTSSWNNRFEASNGTTSTRVSTNQIAQYSTTQYGVVKYQVDLTLKMGSGKYDYMLTKLDGAGTILQQSTLAGLNLNTTGNYWDNNNPNKTFNQLVFQSSTNQMTAHFDRIIVSTDPISPIPEPGTFVLAGAGIAFLSLSRRRRKG